MANPYFGEIRLFAGNFAPAGWMFCDGTVLAISENTTLFQLIGTTYGGDGQQTFALPDLRGRVPIHMGQGAGGSNYVIGQKAGSETVTLTVVQIPAHAHVPNANSNHGTATTPTGNVWAGSADFSQYAAGSTGNMAAGAVNLTGGSQPHDNRLPYLSINFIISLFGIFPSQG
jgi:microcystin-dependent protein